MRLPLLLAAALVTGCLSSHPADEGACEAPDEDAVCVGAAPSAEAGCVTFAIDGSIAWPAVDESPVLTVTHQGADPDRTLSLRVPLTLSGHVFEESADPALARVSTIWIGPSDDASAGELPADSLTAPTHAARPVTRYRVRLRFDETTGALEDGRVDMLEASPDADPRLTTTELDCLTAR